MSSADFGVWHACSANDTKWSGYRHLHFFSSAMAVASGFSAPAAAIQTRLPVSVVDTLPELSVGQTTPKSALAENYKGCKHVIG